MTSDQSPPAPATPSAASEPQPQPPAVDPCKGGLFRAVNAGAIDRSTDAATVRERVVSFDVGTVQAMPARLDLNLFDDVCVVAVRQLDAEAGPVPVWTGSIEGVPGSQVTIIFNPGAAAGSIVMPPQAFNLELVRDGYYRIREVDVTKYPNELPPMTPPPSMAAPGAGSPAAPPTATSPGATPPTAPPPPTGAPSTAAPPTGGPPPPTAAPQTAAPPTKPPPPKKKQP